MIDYSAGLKIAGVLFAAAVCWAWIGVIIDARRKRKNQNRRRVRTIVRSEHDRSIIGDGAWTAHERPVIGLTGERVLNRRREAEPRGM